MAEQERVRATRPEDADDAVLSEAARGVIRQDADPRLDAHLARMLSDAEVVPPRRRGGDQAADSDLAAIRAEAETARSEADTARSEAETARSEAETARAEAAAARHQARILTGLLAVAVVLIVALLALVVLR